VFLLGEKYTCVRTYLPFNFTLIAFSVADPDPGFGDFFTPGSGMEKIGSGMFIPDPDFYTSRIPDLGSRIQKQQQKRGLKQNFLSYLFFVAKNFTKLNIILFLIC
jgi:hypothetical protein